MSETEKQPTTVLESDFSWPEVKLTQLGAMLKPLVAEFAGDPPLGFRSSVAWNGPPQRRKSYDSVDEWIAALALKPDEFDLSAGAYQSGRSLSVRAYQLRDRARVSISFTVPDAEVPAATETLNRVERDLGLVLLRPFAPRAETLAVAIRRTFILQKPANADWVCDAVDAAEKRLGAPAQGRVVVRASAGGDVEREVKSAKNLRDLVVARWSEVVRIDCYISGDAGELSIDVNFDRSEMLLNARAADPAASEALLAVVTQGATLEQSDNTQPLAGGSADFFTQRPLDQKWLESAVTALREIVRVTDLIEARYTLASRRSEQQSRRDVDLWQAEVTANWPQILEGSCWLGGRGVNARLDFAPRRDFVRLEIQTASADRAAAIIDRLAKQLGLDQRDEDQNANRRSAKTYKIARWGNRAFGEAVANALTRIYGAREPDVEEAHVDEEADGKNERKWYTDRDAFLARVRDPRPFGEAVLQVRGARDVRFSVRLTTSSKAKRRSRLLDLSAAMDAKEFQDLFDIFDPAIGLTESDESGAPGGANASAKPDGQSSDRPFLEGTRKLLFTVIGTALVSSGVWLWVIPKNDLIITLPRASNGDSLTLAVGKYEARIEWIVRHHQFFSTKTQDAVPATVRVLRNASDIETTLAPALPGIVVQLAPGAFYDIEVRVDNIGERKVLRVAVPALPTPAPSAAPKQAPKRK